MTTDEFWEHIQKTKRRDPEAHEEKLTARLAKLPPEEILDFTHWWQVYICEAYDWNLWGAAYIINGGCSDDGFHYFCEWLLLQGREVFQAAVSDPDSLADVVDGDEAECSCSASINAWFQATGEKRNDNGFAAFDTAMKARHKKLPKYPKLDNDWDHDDDKEIRRRYPRLYAMYMGDDD